MVITMDKNVDVLDMQIWRLNRYFHSLATWLYIWQRNNRFHSV